MSHTPWQNPPPRRPLTLPFDLPGYWTPEQALAVVELLDDLRERIASHYAVPLNEAMRETYGTHPESDPISFPEDEDPF
jgi:hypothetical protein